MIPYSRDPQQMIPTSAVKIIGLGGAGANMLARIAVDGMEGAELLALNTDVRTLASSLALEKIQLGVNLTKGLGAGGDPELGQQAILESEDQIRLAIQVCQPRADAILQSAQPVFNTGDSVVIDRVCHAFILHGRAIGQARWDLLM